MKIIDNIKDFNPNPAGYAITIGNFDGVHSGHQEIIAKTIETAQKYGVQSSVITFDPHPVALLHPEKTPGVLTPLPLKIKIMDSLGIDNLVIIRDSMSLLNLSPEQFVDDFLIKTLNPKAMIEGDNFNFGYGRSGNINTLKDLGQKRGFEVISLSVPMSANNNSICSSSRIRDLLEKGQVSQAARLLTRNYRLIGQTKPGRGVGTTLGFPTANIEPHNQIIPAEGVYAGYVIIGDTFDEVLNGGEKLPSAFSIGRAKTFLTDYPLLVEAHILTDNVPPLYGKYLAMDFVEKIRNQQRFKTKEHLKAQIKLDCSKVSQVLKSR